ncbi:MAG: sporulation integral membrane protein YtvI [Clostridia bacterium]|nr:sporulation integral membrane protein YtvI [Clostridia bacterium]
MDNRDRNTPPSAREPEPAFDLRQGAAAVICIAAGVFALWLGFRYALGIALPFLLAWLLSRPVKPLASTLARRTRLPVSVWAAGLVILTVGGFVGLAVSGTRRGIRELATLAEELAADTDGLVAAVEGALERARSLSSRIPFLRHFEDTPGYEDFCARLDSLVEEGTGRLVSSITARIPDAAMTVAGWLPAAFVFITVMLLACYYFSADDGRIGKAVEQAITRLTPAGLRDHLPPLGRRLRRLGKQYLRACLLLGLLTFAQMFIGLALLRIPYAFILAFLIALVDFLPLLGTGIILIPWAAVSLLLGEIKLGIGLLVLYAVSSVIRQILEPKLIGEGLGLHPLLSLVSMYAGLRLFGVWGMILAPLVTAGIKSVVGRE